MSKHIEHKPIFGIEHKLCNDCHEWKQLHSFNRDKSRWDHLQARCKQCNVQCKKQYYQDNKESVLNANKQYYYKNVDWFTKYRQDKRTGDIKVRITENLRRRVHHVLKDGHKSAPTFQLIGCGIDQLKQHLEQQFTDGMTWDNYGEWHVDHIRPCASFDLSVPEEQHKCFHYSNLQPLWAKDNLSKGDSYE